MSARNSSFLYWFIGRLVRGAVPVDGILWFDPRASGPGLLKSAAESTSTFHDQAADCDDCPAPIF